MLVLALDTATPALTVGLVRVDEGIETSIETVAAHVQVDARRHGELLTPAITTMLEEAGVKPADLDAIVAGLGPGPFTGLRVGLATGAALADAVGIPVYGVCSLDGIRTPPEPTLVATDARRREIYWATYVRGQRVHGPAVDRPQAVADRLPELGVTAMAGAGAEQYADVLGLPLLDARYPTVATLVERAVERVRAGAPADPLTPLYLRRPDVTMPTARKPVTPA